MGAGQEQKSFLLEILINSDKNYKMVGAFQFEVQKQLGIQVDVGPTFSLRDVDDKNFVQSLQNEAVKL